MFNIKDALYAGEVLNIPFDKFTIEDLLTGMNIELEHGLTNSKTNVTDNDIIKTAKIALAHLNEYPNYYNNDYGLPMFENFLKQKMNEKTGETLSDEEREYYKLVIMDKMHSKVVGVSELGYDTDKVEEARTDSHVDRVMRKFGIRRNMPKPPDGSDVPNDPTR